MPDRLTDQPTYKSYPFYEVARAVQGEIARGRWVLQKFSCQHCGNRLTMSDANVFYTYGTCDKCQGYTNIEQAGCNFSLLIPGRRSLTELAAVSEIKPPIEGRRGLTIIDKAGAMRELK